MGFAGAYLQNHQVRNTLISSEPDPRLDTIVIIPCFNESGLLKSLDSLFLSGSDEVIAEVIIFINSPENTSPEIKEQNISTYNQTSKWIEKHLHSNIKFHLLMDNELPVKHAGVGLARKILMDEAVRRFNQINNPNGIILSMDADATVERSYLKNTLLHFRKNPETEGCSIYFEHPLEGEDFDQSVYSSIILYELHLRYYLHALRFTGYPYAYHTVGSSLGIRAEAYGKYGGMNRRQGGEDFYFIQKVAQNGHFSDCTTTAIIPSPRTSDRVPFGTGPVIQKLINNQEEAFKTYHIDSFAILKEFYTLSQDLFSMDDPAPFMNNQHRIMRTFLENINFTEIFREIRSNSASAESFITRFYRNFNMFRILKFLHHARESGLNDMPVAEAASNLLIRMGIEIRSSAGARDLLLGYRKLDRKVLI